MYKVTVKVGEREFSGEGLTAQAARHDAAAKALDQLRNLPLEPSMVEAIVASKFFLKKYPVSNRLQSELIPISLAFSLEVPYGGPSTVFSLRCAFVALALLRKLERPLHLTVLFALST